MPSTETRLYLRLKDLSISQLWCIGILLSSLAGQSVAQVDRMPLWFSAPVFLFLLFLGLWPSSLKVSYFATNQNVDEPRFSERLVVCLFGVIPSAVYLLVGWGGETPFGGDQLSHLSQSFRAAAHWLSPIGSQSPASEIAADQLLGQYVDRPMQLLKCRFVLFIGVIIVAALLLRAGGSATSLWLIAVCIAWALVDTSTNFRWPPLTFFLSIPFVAVSEIGEWDNQLNALRLFNFLAIPIWLLLLRPAFIGKWPTWSLLPVLTLIFWNHLAIRFYGSSYPDAWAWVFVLTAVEVLVSAHTQRLLAVTILISIASLFKELAIVLMPFFWVAALKPEQIWQKNNWILGLASIIPFTLYFFARITVGEESAGHVRDQGLRLWRPDVDTNRFLDLGAQYISEIHANLFLSELVLVVLSAALIVWMWRKHQRYRWSIFWCLLGGLSLIVFLLLDRSTGPNMRFAFWLTPFLTVGWFLVPNRNYRELSRNGTSLWLVTCLAIVWQSWALFESRAKVFVASPSANFVISRGEPLYLPINELFAGIERADPDAPKLYYSREIDPFVHLTRYTENGERIIFLKSRSLLCECSVKTPAIVNMFVKLVNNRERLAATDRSKIRQQRAASWVWPKKEKEECLRKALVSCSTLVSLYDDVELAGFIAFDHQLYFETH